MEFQEYLSLVKSRFVPNAEIRADNADSLVTYEEIFKWSWIATKLKITSFVKYVDSVKLNDIEAYSESCLKQAVRDKKGLPVGFQNGVVSCNVIASESFTPTAIQFALSRPKKYFAAMEYPALFDLKSGGLHYYMGEMVWGSIYDSFMKKCLFEHFCGK
ncbi:MAG: hypothetical protein FWG90_13355 [Oscillospiraceae bacterium]|nr:hypothetical protein [Oscillospiraceae bacterium]